MVSVAVDFGPLLRGGDRVVGRDDAGRQRGVGFGRLLRPFHQVVVFLAAEQHPLRLLLQEDVQVGEGDVDFPRGPLGRRQARRRSRCAQEGV